MVNITTRLAPPTLVKSQRLPTPSVNLAHPSSGSGLLPDGAAMFLPLGLAVVCYIKGEPPAWNWDEG